MPEPEISRRCQSCGASARESAAFCPQCGKGLRQQNPNAEKTSTATVTAPLDDVPNLADTLTDTLKIEAPAVQIAEKPGEPHEKKAIEAEGQPAKASTSQESERGWGVVSQAAGPTPTLPASGEGVKHEKAEVGKVRDKIQRVTTLARDVEGDVIHRVQKVREISSVVLDEAGYDPSLRFVLVAGVLFVLFLLIMLLNKLIG
jgi:hypothetical protein